MQNPKITGKTKTRKIWWIHREIEEIGVKEGATVKSTIIVGDSKLHFQSIEQIDRKLAEIQKTWTIILTDLI